MDCRGDQQPGTNLPTRSTDTVWFLTTPATTTSILSAVRCPLRLWPRSVAAPSTLIIVSGEDSRILMGPSADASLIDEAPRSARMNKHPPKARVTRLPLGGCGGLNP